MRKTYSTFGRKSITGFLIAVTFLLTAPQIASAQVIQPFLPRLGLLPGPQERTPLGNDTYYPDKRIYSAHAPDNGVREILVPVFIKNGWISTETEEVEPIRSFTFKVQYDSRALLALGVEKHGPLSDDDFALAKNFQIEWDDAEDKTYQESLGDEFSGDPNGRRIKITGTSAATHGLPPSPSGIQDPTPEDREFVEMLYIRFKVVARPGGFGSSSPLIITNDTLRWNDRTPTEAQFENQAIPGKYAGLAGIDNSNTNQFGTEPTRFGVIYLRVTALPRIGFGPNQGGAKEVDMIDQDPSRWELTRNMDADSATWMKEQWPSGNIGPQDARREIDVLNLTAETRLLNVTIESDSRWLKFRTIGQKNPIPGLTRRGFVDFIDNTTLGPGQLDPNGDETDQDPRMVLEIVADPQELEATNSPAGVYVGWLTFYSETAEFSPVRLRVVFVYYRNPIEPYSETDTDQHGGLGVSKGIRIDVENSNSEDLRVRRLIFGTGVLASNEVDELFGEDEYPFPPFDFDARWYPKDEDGNDISANGLGDRTNRSVSLDVRDALADTTVQYHARFTADPEDYPVVISWDTQDFPEGAALFLRDTLNGSIFSVNMREATNIGGTRFSYTIEDARIYSFIIEYTPTTVARFPVLNKGWNLISLPVAPSAKNYKDILPNSLDEPQYFSADLYFADDEPDFGRGYFVKYGDVLDSIMAGVSVCHIGVDSRYKVRLEEGWNTIGALSQPLDTDEGTSFSFDALEGQTQVPNRVGQIYSYVTDQGYQRVNILNPGLGYWLKVDYVGYLNLTCPADGKLGEVVDNGSMDLVTLSNELKIRGNGNREGTLYIASQDFGINTQEYALPPVPASGMFDVRFNSGTFVEDKEETFVKVRGIEYPFVLTMDRPDASYQVIDPRSQKVIGTLEQGSFSTVQIEDENLSNVLLKRVGTAVSGFAVEQNYPNPAVNTTSVKFSVPTKEFVTVTLFNTLGQEVKTIFSNFVEAGSTQSVSFDVSDLQNGSYIYKITAGDYTATRTLTVVK